MRVMKRWFPLAATLALGILLGAVLARTTERRVDPTLRTSLAVNDQAVAALVAARVKQIVWTDADGLVSHYQVAGGPAANRALTLIGRTPLEVPDDHGSATLATVNVAGGKATVAWVSRTDRRPFGEDLWRVDCRVVTVVVEPTTRPAR